MWRPETVRAWHTARPGKTGRPRKTNPEKGARPLGLSG
jgi:hypothetical protein